MDLSKAQNININTAYKDRRVAPNWETRLFADIVIVDQTQSGVHPHVYQVRDNDVSVNDDQISSSTAFNSFTSDSFILLGEVQILEKQKKQILLTNNNVLSYRYLILVAGSKFPFHQPEFSSGLQTLIEAVRVKSKTHTAFPLASIVSPYTTRKQSLTIDTHEKPEPADDIKKLVNHSLSEGQNSDVSFNVINKRLYVVQL